MGILSYLPVRPSWHQAFLFLQTPHDLSPKASLFSYYSLREKDLIGLFQKAWELEPAHPLHALISMLERRLENVVCRMGFAASVPESRTLIRRGHILVNRHRPQGPSLSLRPGDVVHYTSRPYDASSVSHFPRRLLPSYLQYLNPRTTDRGVMLSLPTFSDSLLQPFRTIHHCPCLREMFH